MNKKQVDLQAMCLLKYINHDMLCMNARATIFILVVVNLKLIAFDDLIDNLMYDCSFQGLFFGVINISKCI